MLGARVKGGRYGERPSLAGLRRWDRAPFHVDFRDYFGSVVDGWLGGGGHEVFGRRIDDLGLFVGPPLGGGSGGGALPPGASPGTLVPVAATRIADTRKGLGAARRALGPDSTLRVAVAGVGPVPPTGVRAVVANVTLVRPTQRTHFRVFAGGARRPDASTVNAPAGEAVPNLCVVPVGADGTIAVYNAAGHAHCVVDVFGYYAAHGGTRFSSLAPGRLLDTRTGVGARSRTVRAGEEIVLQVAGREGVPATGVTAAALNLTTVGASARGHVVAWRTGASRPETSNLNYVPGRAIANLAIVPVDANGRVSLWVSGGEVDLVADVVGSFGASGRDQFVPLSGSRVLEHAGRDRSTPPTARGGTRDRRRARRCRRRAGRGERGAAQRDRRPGDPHDAPPRLPGGDEATEHVGPERRTGPRGRQPRHRQARHRRRRAGLQRQR